MGAECHIFLLEGISNGMLQHGVFWKIAPRQPSEYHPPKRQKKRDPNQGFAYFKETQSPEIKRASQPNRNTQQDNPFDPTRFQITKHDVYLGFAKRIGRKSEFDLNRLH